MGKLTMSTLKAAANKIGATVDDSMIAYGSVNVYAPRGMVWSCSGDIHVICLHWFTLHNGKPMFPEMKTDAIRDAIERIGDGLTPCDDPECEWCNSEHED